jgi:hypothetical protein
MAEMNVRARLFMNAGRGRSGARLLACVGAGTLLSGCINPFVDAKVDPNSVVAPDVAKAAHIHTKYPTFASIPPVPKDVRPHPQYGVAAKQTDQARADLERATAPETWTLNDTETFAEAGRQTAGPDAAPAAGADTESFANALRKRATPPPPPKR